MQPIPDHLRSICRHWLRTAADSILPLDHAAWSGADVYAVTAGRRDFVLKRCGSGISRPRAEWVHALMRHTRSIVGAAVPEVICGTDGSTLHEDATGGLWELVERMPGAACQSPDTAQRTAAAEILAAIHLAAATVFDHAPRLDVSPGVIQRRMQSAALLARPWHAWPAHRLSGPLSDRLRCAAAVMAAHDGQRALERVVGFDPGMVLVQPVLRDVWSEHVLFSGHRVTGVIDWHAAGIDSPATDIGRLTGSWPNASGHRHPFMQAYERLRPLEPLERRLTGFLDAAGVVCGIDNWLRWTLEEQRRFADMRRVLDRIDQLVDRLPEALGELADHS